MDVEKRQISCWKKVFENDLVYISQELKERVKRPAAIILSGEVGVGKTTFTKVFAKTNDLMGPTYSIINEIGDMVHIDLYRLQDMSELAHLEIELYLDDKNYCLLEWGMKYLAGLNQYLDGRFSYFELDISLNSATDDTTIFSRNYELFELDLGNS